MENDSAKKAESPLMQEIAEHDKMLNQLGIAIEELSKRLAPVLAPGDPQIVSDTENKISTNSSTTEKIRGMSAYLNIKSNELDDLRARLEV